MRRLVVLGLVVVAAACSSGQSEGTAASPSTGANAESQAIDRVREVWQECLALAGTTVDGATAEPTPTEKRVPADSDGVSIEVTLASGEQFIVVVGGRLTGARVSNDKADATLSRATNAGGDCG